MPQDAHAWDEQAQAWHLLGTLGGPYKQHTPAGLHPLFATDAEIGAESLPGPKRLRISLTIHSQKPEKGMQSYILPNLWKQAESLLQTAVVPTIADNKFQLLERGEYTLPVRPVPASNS